MERKGCASLSKHKIEVGICCALFAWTSVSPRQAAKAARNAKREKNKIRETIKKRFVSPGYVFKPDYGSPIHDLEMSLKAELYPRRFRFLIPYFQPI